ncbi:DinB family protein [Rubrivirga sp.]|uniref:DinB family protein n=1 Tax=Rubrivirga sp. TaxID=1885344 RepID=UPI003C71B5F0
MTLPAYDAADPTAYVESRLALVEGQDPIALLEAAPGRVARALEGVTEKDARRPEADGAWSILEVVRHLADSEIVYGYRLRLIASADRPEIVGYDQETWAETLKYHRGTVADAHGDYASARRSTVRFLTSLPGAAWDRVGLHSERGEESIRRIVALLAAHDIGHGQQIERVRSVLDV